MIGCIKELGCPSPRDVCPPPVGGGSGGWLGSMPRELVMIPSCSSCSWKLPQSCSVLLRSCSELLCSCSVAAQLSQLLPSHPRAIETEPGEG